MRISARRSRDEFVGKTWGNLSGQKTRPVRPTDDIRYHCVIYFVVPGSNNLASVILPPPRVPSTLSVESLEMMKPLNLTPPASTLQSARSENGHIAQVTRATAISHALSASENGELGPNRVGAEFR